MQRLEVSGAVRPIYVSLGFKRLISQSSRGQKVYELVVFLLCQGMLSLTL